MKKRLAIVLLTLAAGTATAQEPAPTAADKQLAADIKSMQWYQVCTAWGRAARRKDNRRADTLRDHLLHRQLINGVDLMHVGTREPHLGMTSCGVLANMGTPSVNNSTQSATGIRQQMVYRDRNIYVYLDGQGNNGIVGAIQR